ncbi:MAG: hypothetical protein GVX78_00135 [Bacteroidetes bacterium]|jgi:hypothetical protein|nr:hypothetical protein [Bacteroidota bacterium]
MKDYLTELSVLLKKYVELSIDELRLGQTQLFINLAAGLMALTLIGLVLLLIIILLVVSGCLFLAEMWDSMALGLLGGAGILLILFFILQVFNNELVLRPIKTMIVKIISEES